MFAAIYYVHFRRFTRILICAGLIVGYAILLCTIVAPDYPNASSLSIEGNFIGWLDRTTMPGKLWQGAEIGGKYVKSLCEPSGLYANFFAAATAYGKISKFFLGGVAAHCSLHAGEFLLACGYLAACWLTLYFLYRKKTFLKVAPK